MRKRQIIMYLVAGALLITALGVYGKLEIQ